MDSLLAGVHAQVNLFSLLREMLRAEGIARQVSATAASGCLPSLSCPSVWRRRWGRGKENRAQCAGLWGHRQEGRHSPTRRHLALLLLCLVLAFPLEDELCCISLYLEFDTRNAESLWEESTRLKADSQQQCLSQSMAPGVHGR